MVHLQNGRQPIFYRSSILIVAIWAFALVCWKQMSSLAIYPGCAQKALIIFCNDHFFICEEEGCMNGKW